MQAGGAGGGEMRCSIKGLADLPVELMSCRYLAFILTGMFKSKLATVRC